MEKKIKELEEEIKKLNKKMRKQKWLNLYLLFR